MEPCALFLFLESTPPWGSHEKTSSSRPGTAALYGSLGHNSTVVNNHPFELTPVAYVRILSDERSDKPGMIADVGTFQQGRHANLGLTDTAAV